MIGQGAEWFGTQRSRRVQPVGVVQVEGHQGHPSVDAAQAVDGYFLDEELIYDGNVFFFRLAVISAHFIKTFLPNGPRYLHCQK